ncbi:Histone deacetylase superfamily,Histone deacetylase,Histone deacetylase domain [Cinara cedri]|uniref:Histone deacetylase n=1 Tax=Cinara cedri TaxID=506608 RepID=A0A5E4MY99_9HEMI|nr:Histone deacetylase superfamily,Histone deacetylase,Histone deacetylase domain [Cinara cedri]
MDHNVCYISDPQLLEECCKIPNVPQRAYFVDSLIKAYGLTNHMDVFKVKPSTYENLIDFHSSAYIDYLKNLNDKDDSTDDGDEYGIGYDCPALKNIWQFSTYIAGGSLTAAESLTSMKYRFAINWCGGWHHALRDSAQGFCYINDIVLAIETLRKTFGRVLYIDLDVHHGNGVEYAYYATDRVLTLSFHQYEPGFYPTSGSLNDIGQDKGKYYTVNVPLKEGIPDDKYIKFFHKISNLVYSSYNPKCVVVQCGADSLVGDTIGGFNLTPKAHAECIKNVMKWELPTLFVGGGGYNESNAARCWTLLTAIITGQDNTLFTDIPDNEYFSVYGPDFTLNINPGNRKDYNTAKSLNNIFNFVESNMKIIKALVRPQQQT